MKKVPEGGHTLATRGGGGGALPPGHAPCLVGPLVALRCPSSAILDFKEFNYDNCSLIDCISLLQSVLNSPHGHDQNKAFTKHIVDALMQSYEEKLNLEVSIPRTLYYEWEPTIKIKIKDYECYALCDLGASVSAISKTLCD